MNNSEIVPADFAVPFPPEIEPEEVISQRSFERLQSRPPNRFFVYRLAYLKQLRKMSNKKKFSMTKISPHISKSWAAERIEVKEEYRKLADKAGELLNVTRKKSFVVVTENPAPPPQMSTPPTPPILSIPPMPPTPLVEPEPPVIPYLSEQEIHNLFCQYFGFQPELPIPSLSEQEIHYLLYLYFGF